jgi:nicotinate-nucleotide--dimethylbenzimidazole phosphoribosyltransferase
LALRILAQLGGLEIAVLAGATLGAAARRVPVLLDGYITTAAALVAAGLAPNVAEHLVAGHCAAEPGHALALAQLGLTEEAGAGPLLRLDLRLGEGSGAALAIPLLRAATRLMREMATFDEAGVSDRE